MSIENLIKAVPPPAAPTYPFDGPWGPIEARLRTSLPQDYKDLVRLYGSGDFMETVGAFSPADPRDHLGFLPQVYTVQRDFVRYFPHISMYPAPGGLLVCGDVAETGYIFWLTRGPVSEWPIVVWDHDPIGPELETFECGVADFLAGVIAGEIWPEAFPAREDLRDAEAFRPFSELTPTEGQPQ